MSGNVAPVSGHVEIGDRRLDYCLYNGGGSQRVVFEYGTPGTQWLSTRLVAAARRADCALLVVERPGYGTTSRRPGRRVIDVASDVEVVVDHFAWDEFAVWGGSGGAPHALAIAAQLADRVSACASVVGLAPFDSPGLDWFAGMSDGNVTEFIAAASGEHDYRPLVAQLSADAMTNIEHGGSAVADAYELPESDRAALIERQNEDGYRDQMMAMFGDGVDGWIDDSIAFTRPWGFDLESITTPASVWWGADDALVSASHSAHLLSTIPLSEAHALAGGHLLGDSDLDAIYEWLTTRNGLAR